MSGDNFIKEAEEDWRTLRGFEMGTSRSPTAVDWTPFAKKPPPGPGFYLVTCIHDYDTDPIENAYVQVTFWDGREWNDDGGHESIVVAWAEAPVPYKG